MAALAALALAGCSASHVGDDWQCPLAQGKVCASVAAADPAVPLTRGAANPAHDVPLYRRGGGRIAADETACASDCDPFAWLGSLFAGIADAGSADSGTAVSRRNSHVGTAAPAETANPRVNPAAPTPGAAHNPAAPAGHPVSGAYATESAAIAPAEPGNAPPPARDGADGSAGTEDASDAAFDDALRTGEVVARIWIAPFVDENGIYREGSWVRAVIAPAAWRLP